MGQHVFVKLNFEIAKSLVVQIIDTSWNFPNETLIQGSNPLSPNYQIIKNKKKKTKNFETLPIH